MVVQCLRLCFLLYFIYLIFWPSCAAAWKVEDGILVPQPGMYLCPLQPKHRILTAGPPGIDSTSWVMQPKKKKTSKNTSALPQQGAQVWSLVRELRSRMLHSRAKKKKSISDFSIRYYNLLDLAFSDKTWWHFVLKYSFNHHKIMPISSLVNIKICMRRKNIWIRKKSVKSMSGRLRQMSHFPLDGFKSLYYI